jgi:hypothetical protein
MDGVYPKEKFRRWQNALLNEYYSRNENWGESLRPSIYRVLGVVIVIFFDSSRVCASRG